MPCDEHAAHVVLGQPGEHRLAGRGRVRASVLPSVPVSTRTGWRDSRLATFIMASPCSTARCTVSPVFSLICSMNGAARAGRSTCSAGIAEIENARAERVGAPHRHLGDIAALHQRREQVVAGGDVELGAVRQFGQRGLAAGLGDRLEQRDRAVDRLDAVALGALAAPRRGRQRSRSRTVLSSKAFPRVFLRRRKEIAGRRSSQARYEMANFDFAT